MIFVLRQLQKKCREQNMGLHAAFIDIMKAYDTVSRDGPWKILIKLGCMSKFLTVLSSCTKDRIQVKLSDLSDTFPIGNCVKHSRTCLTDDSIFNLCRLPAQTKTTEELITDLLLADNCALLVYTEVAPSIMSGGHQPLCDSSQLIRSDHQPEEIMHQKHPQGTYSPPKININSHPPR